MVINYLVKYKGKTFLGYFQVLCSLLVDMLRHLVLLETIRLRSIDLDNSSCEWIENDIKDCIWRFVIDKVVSGVPQALVLELLHFNLFIKDIGAWIKNTISVFVDDT